jgi:hypothetical protein
MSSQTFFINCRNIFTKFLHTLNRQTNIQWIIIARQMHILIRTKVQCPKLPSSKSKAPQITQITPKISKKFMAKSKSKIKSNTTSWSVSNFTKRAITNRITAIIMTMVFQCWPNAHLPNKVQSYHLIQSWGKSSSTKSILLRITAMQAESHAHKSIRRPNLCC